MRGKDKTLQFVDTNVLVYAHDCSAGEKYQRAKSLLEDLWKSGMGCLSLQALQEFYVTVTQKVPKPIPLDEAIQIVLTLSKWQVHTPGIVDLIRVTKVQRLYQLSFWDTMILTSAETLGCEILWSEDFNPDQRYGGFRSSTPFDECALQILLMRESS